MRDVRCEPASARLRGRVVAAGAAALDALRILGSRRAGGT
jgi:hypothetical protein